MEKFRVGLTRDFLAPNGELALGDIGLQKLTTLSGISVEFFQERLSEVSEKQTQCYDAIISMAPRYTRSSFGSADLGLSLVARLGVGYDMVDVEALTEHDVMLTITPDGVRRPMAGGIVALLLALTHKLLAKDHLVRAGKWQERTSVKATGLTGRTFGAVGFGNIGREVFHLLKPFEMVHLAADPFVKPQEAAALGAELVDLETLMRQSDVVSIHCPLNNATRNMIGQRELSWMKPTAFFINAARGPIVDQAALCDALKEGRIGGAGLDVFEPEPLGKDDPLLALDNVILTPHTLCWTDECFLRMGESAIESVLAALRGEIPQHVVNRRVLESPGMRAKLEANRSRWRELARREKN